jgi:DNA-binding HxlR family transcriptional regulator
MTEQLRELEADRLVGRMATGPATAPVEYSLSAYGGTVLPLVEAARTWGEAHLHRTRGSRHTPAGTALGCAEATALA